MLKILRYSFSDISRSQWSYFYFAFYFIIGFTLLFLSSDVSKAVITLVNIILVLSPLIGTVFGVIYFYNSKEFTQLLLAKPIKRSTIFIGQYLGLSLSLSFSFVLGLGFPFLFYGIFRSPAIGDFFSLLISGVFLTFIFTALAFNIALSNENKIKGFAAAILLWLLLAVIYDGLFLISLMVFNEYPLEKVSLIATALNPIDLSRILVLLKLDISALLGYTGAVFQKFFGGGLGMLISIFILMLWTVLPILRIMQKIEKRIFNE
ncbi:MAG: ABC transporter permease [Spirochaetia bacterium]|nr:ABC transporter permease [Spirochaetia bacterium]